MKQLSRVPVADNSDSSSQIAKPYKDDTTVWKAFKNGSESAFIYIYEAYFDSLYIYGSQFTRDDGRVKDAIQDLFVELRKNRARLGDTDSIKFYLFKCLKRKVIKESGRWFNKYEEFSGDVSFNFTMSHEQVLIDRQLDVEKTAALNKAIQSLSPRKREVIYYFYYEGMSYQEIQELMEMSHVKSVRNLLYKAIDLLRENIISDS